MNQSIKMYKLNAPESMNSAKKKETFLNLR